MRSFADASKNGTPQERARSSPSVFVTWRRSSRSHLLPTRTYGRRDKRKSPTSSSASKNTYQWNLGHVFLDANNLIAKLDDFLERGTGGYRVNEQEALAVAVVAVAHHRVLLLAGSIKNIEQARLLVDRDGLAINVFDGGYMRRALTTNTKLGGPHGHLHPLLLPKRLRTIIVLHKVRGDKHAGECALADTTAANHHNLVLGHMVIELMEKEMDPDD